MSSSTNRRSLYSDLFGGYHHHGRPCSFDDSAGQLHYNVESHPDCCIRNCGGPLAESILRIRLDIQSARYHRLPHS
jgi:hypothetical protein